MDVLAYLAVEPGRVVSKEELLAAVWAGAFVEEGALSQAIHSLRKAMGDDARQPRYVQTIPKRGYRLVASVEFEPEPEPTGGLEESTVPSPAPPSILPALPNSRPNWVWLVLATVGVATVLAALLLRRDRPDEARSALAAVPAPRQDGGLLIEGGIRIVVLPFEDLNEPQDPHFAAGLTQEMTANLALISALQVIPSRSAARYRDGHKSISEIGKELNVDYVLEGKVDWYASRRVRVMPQLIHVADEKIVWAAPYEGTVDDLFSAREGISRGIIGELEITLLPEEKQALARRPTADLVAYQSYIKGLVVKNQPFYSPSDLDKAALLFKRAVDKDQGFAEAWAELSQVHSYLAFNTDPSPTRIEKARDALARALDLAPNLPSVRMAQVYFSYRCLADFDNALVQIEDAVRVSPNNSELLKTKGLVLLRKGQFPEAIETFHRALVLDPRTSELTWILAETYRAQRDYRQADQAFAQAISMDPDIPYFWEQRALNRLSWTGEPKEARAILDEAPMPRATPQLQLVDFKFDLAERKYRQALTRLASAAIKELPLQDQSRLAVLGVLAREHLKDSRGALTAAEENLSTLENRVAHNPREPIFRAYLALTLAQLGRGEEALAQAEEAARQSQDDAFSGPRVLEVQAMVDATLGRHSEAIARLRRLLHLQYRAAISPAELRLDPMWDPIRGAPGFEALTSDLTGSRGEE